MNRVIWQPPRLRTIEEDARASTWTELFFDLVFVVAVSAIGGRFLHDLGWQGFGEFIVLFTLLWWAWASYTFFADRYDTDDTAQRLLAVVQMVGVAGMAASVGGEYSLSDLSSRFAAAYALVRIVLCLMYARAWWHVPETKPLVGGYLRGFSLDALLWTASVFVPPPWRYVLWAGATLISFATPWLVRHQQARVPLSITHLPERFGLFTILVLGELIAAIVVGVDETRWALVPVAIAVASVVETTSLWWVYFDNLEGSVVRRDPSKLHDRRPTMWIYSHLPLAGGVIVASVGTEGMLLSEAGGHGLDAMHRWLSAGGVAVALLAMALILVTSVPSDPRTNLRRAAIARVTGAAVALVLAVAGGGMAPEWFAVALAVICAGQVATDIAAHWAGRNEA